jgi:hypothetical protein
MQFKREGRAATSIGIVTVAYQKDLSWLQRNFGVNWQYECDTGRCQI